MKRNPLTPEEEWVLVHKGTERPFTGEYDDLFEPGTYVCRWCDTPLYRAESKFNSGCGWPAFDDEIPGAVRRAPDPDGHRTEIVCAACGGPSGPRLSGREVDPQEHPALRQLPLPEIHSQRERLIRSSLQTLALFGATGLTGRAVLAEALRRGISVKALCRPDSVPLPPSPSLRILEGSILDPESVAETIRGTQAVCAVFGPRPPYTEVFCAQAMQSILEEMKRLGVRRLICQTGAMVGEKFPVLFRSG